MSGLLAVLSLDGRPIDRAALTPCIDRLAYRGRDGGGTWLSDEGSVLLSVAHRHVTRTDARDHQPATRSGVTLISDSLLLARADLVTALRAAGQRAALDHPDSALLLSAWHAWGERCVEHLTGEFSFVLWDARRRSLFAATDRLRVRELVYAALPGVVIIANELMSVLLHPAVSGALDEGTVGDFLLFGLVERHNKAATLFRDLRRLLPAHWLRADADAGLVTLHRYWDFPLDLPMRRLSKPEDYVIEFRALFRQVMRERVQDVDRVMVMMSGGMDSTSTAAMIADLIRSGEVSTRLSAHTLGYRRIVPDSEPLFVEKTARFLDDMPVYYMYGDDYAMTEPPPTRLDPVQDFSGRLILDVERTMAELGTLGVSGNGGDEIFTNTPFYKVLLQHSLPEAARLYLWLWRMTGRRPHFDGVQHYVRGLLRFGRPEGNEQPSYGYPVWLNPDFERRADLRTRWQTPWSYTLKGSHRTQPEVPLYVGLGSWCERTEFTFAKPYTPIDFTEPFIDLRLIEFAMSLPPFPWNKRKLLLRQAMTGLLPPEVLARPKTPAPRTMLALVNMPGVEWIDTWQPFPEAEAYIRRDAVPPIFGTQNPQRVGVDTRPLFFSEWLRGMRAALGK